MLSLLSHLVKVSIIMGPSFCLGGAWMTPCVSWAPLRDAVGNGSLENSPWVPLVVYTPMMLPCCAPRLDTLTVKDDHYTLALCLLHHATLCDFTLASCIHILDTGRTLAAWTPGNLETWCLAT